MTMLIPQLFTPRLLRLPHGDSWVKVFAALPTELMVSQTLYRQLWQLHPAEQSKGMLAGKPVTFPRYTRIYGGPYRFRGNDYAAPPIPHPYLERLLAWVRKDTSHDYRNLLVNWYQDGHHYIGAHSDDEVANPPYSAIYSFTFGQERDFVIQSKDKTFRKVIQARHNSLLIMGGEMQQYYTHAVPKRALSSCSASRINVTFRLFKKS